MVLHSCRLLIWIVVFTEFSLLCIFLHFTHTFFILTDNLFFTFRRNCYYVTKTAIHITYAKILIFFISHFIRLRAPAIYVPELLCTTHASVEFRLGLGHRHYFVLSLWLYDQFLLFWGLYYYTSILFLFHNCIPQRGLSLT